MKTYAAVKQDFLTVCFNNNNVRNNVIDKTERKE